MAVIAILASFFLSQRQRRSVPAEGSQAYEQVTRVFYRGLAALEVGLLDNARQDFTQATRLAADEPAGWANLGLTHLRLGELDAAAEPITHALALAPRNAELELLAARMETARGQIDAGIAHLRRSVELDPAALRPRYALAQQLEQSGTPEADAEALRVLDDLVMRAPENLAVLLDRARLAGKRTDRARLEDSVARIAKLAAGWPVLARNQLGPLQAATAAGNFTDATRSTVLLRNVLAGVTVFRENLTAVATPAELIADPLTRFVVMPTPGARPSPADMELTFASAAFRNTSPGSMVAVYVRDASGALDTFPYDPQATHGLVPMDWNHDFRNDLLLVGPGGVRLMIQEENGAFADRTVLAAGASIVSCDCSAAWAADVDLDGDLDAIVGVTNGPTITLRNNGNGTWQLSPLFASVTSARAFEWADLDSDGDPDAAVLDGGGRVHVFATRPSADFSETTLDIGGVTALTVADVDGDGRFEIVTLDAMGTLRASRTGRAPVTLASGFSGDHLVAADLDNNGSIDLIASRAGGAARVWLSNDDHSFVALPRDLEIEVTAVADMNGDGLLDVIGRRGAEPVLLAARSGKRYHWTTVRPRAQERAGDQRINSFGAGGDIEVRSGLLAQKQPLTGTPAHFGLGSHTSVDVARIVWPNGVPQAEFNVGVDTAVVAEQRLKGSCPWVFAFDGERMSFVTDFLWRSPLGLRINAQDTAGIGQTEDWIRIRGDQLAPRDGTYDIRITAELWETHFFDHVALMVVDHPGATDVFVDERFAASHPPALAVRALRDVKPVRAAYDDGGRDVTDLIARRDGRYLAGFPLGAYQGIAAEHFVEIDLDDAGGAGLTPETTSSAPGANDGRVLVATGWVYPTDSSINLAIAQNDVRPRGVSLEAQDRNGAWRVVEPDLGFPAGKNKTMLIDLSGIGDARRLRLRTNLEVYWDALMVGRGTSEPPLATRVAARSAELRYRGFSRTRSPRGDAPETPDYTRLANTTPRWRDLTGYYTRFGDVAELIDRVDDRYVIMNAGEEMRLRFPAPPAARAGWRRDFVLVGDGWEKDGDFNTGYSATVGPLPTHSRTTYAAASPSLALEDDPVYQQHREDWIRFHTRFVTPDWFLRELRH